MVIAWDTASTLTDSADWSVGTVWGAVGLDFYLLDVVRDRFEAPDLRRAIVALHQRWQADVTLIEKTHMGHALLHDLRQTHMLRPILIPPRYDKEARLLAQSARFEAGQVHLPADAPWLGAYVAELLALPSGRHDDQVDSTSYALQYLTSRQGRTEPPSRRSRESIRANSRRQARNDLIADSHIADVTPISSEPRRVSISARWREGDPVPI